MNDEEIKTVSSWWRQYGRVFEKSAEKETEKILSRFLVFTEEGIEQLVASLENKFKK